MGVNPEARAKWSFGNQASAEGGAVLGSTGTGTQFFVGGLAREHSWYIETAAATTCSYQIVTARTAAGASVVLSSGTLAASAVDLVQITGPLAFTAPRIKTITSTAANVNVTVELYGN